MGAPGGAVYLGKAFGFIASDLKRIVQKLCDIRVSRAEAWLDDVPLLIKALSFSEEKIRADARECLTKLAGDDLGPEPEAWELWWDTKGKALRRQRETEIALERLFAGFRAAIMEGRWGDAAELLHVNIMTGGAEVDAARLIKRNRRTLRQAYRDAGLEDIEINGEAAKLTVSWGRRGFEERDLRARRDGDGWRFSSPPWGRRIVRQPGRAIVQTKPGQRARDRPPVFGGFSAGSLHMLAIAVVWSVGLLAACLYGLFGSIFELGWGPGIALSIAVCGSVTAIAVIVHRKHRTRRRRTHGDPMPLSYHPAARPPSTSASPEGPQQPHEVTCPDSRKPVVRRRFRPARRVTGGRVLVVGTASALFVLFVFGGLGRPVAVAFLIMVGATLVAAAAVELLRVAREAREGAGDAEEPVFPLPPEYNAFPPVVMGCVLTIAAIVSGSLCGMAPGALAGLGAGAAFFAPIIVYTAQYLHRKRRWMQATVEGKLERWQRPDGMLAKLEKRTRPGFSIILLKALVLSIVFILPAFFMILETFGGGARDAFGGIALSAFLVPFPVAYAIHKSIHEPE